MRKYALQKGPCNFSKLRTSPWESSISPSLLSLPLAPCLFFPRAAHTFLPPSLCSAAGAAAPWGHPPSRARRQAGGARAGGTGGAAGGTRVSGSAGAGLRARCGRLRLASGSGAAMARWASGGRLGRLGRSRSSSGSARARRSRRCCSR
jgi:hypothetical protein